MTALNSDPTDKTPRIDSLISDAALKACMLLQYLPGVGPATQGKLISAFGSAEAAISAPLSQLSALLSTEAYQALVTHRGAGDKSELARRLAIDCDWLAQQGARLLLLGEANYPRLLSEISRPPPLLYVLGNCDCLHLPQLAIVGSRNPSVDGARNAYRFAEQLAGNGFVVTSGLALGIDTAAHRGALAAGCEYPTIAVLGSGLDAIYPARNRGLADDILAAGGALVSEFALGSSPQPSHFPRRNRIISGLSLGTLVVEAAERSGSLITARMALEQNREVFAVPGSIHNPVSRGCHKLLREGATLVECGEDIVEQLTGLLSVLAPEEAAVEVEQQGGEQIDLLSAGVERLAGSEREQCVYHALGFDPVDIDSLAEATGLAAAELLTTLTMLELKGMVIQRQGRYCRLNLKCDGNIN